MIKIKLNEINEVIKLKEIIWLLEILKKKDIDQILNEDIINVDNYSEIDIELINKKINILNNINKKKYLSKEINEKFVIYNYEKKIDIYCKKKLDKDEILIKISEYNENNVKLFNNNKEIKKENCHKYDYKNLKISVLK